MIPAAPVLLVNPNRVRPPVAPIAVDLLASALEARGVAARVLDLAFSRSVEDDVRAALRERPALVALTLRNLDDASAASRVSFLPAHAEAIAAIRRHTDAPLVLGGVGFSIAPAAALAALGVDLGVRGEGEDALALLARGRPLEEIPGLVWRDGERFRENPGRPLELAAEPAPRRTFVDNARYLREGAQVGFETSRGCSMACAYCADPPAKGRAVRRRAPESVADELAALLGAGIDVLHTCDAEYNLDRRHAEAVAAAIAARGLGGRLRWYAYCTPTGFTRGLATAMRAAGCVGVNFGVDHVDDALLARLGRAHRLADVEAARDACRRAGLRVMFDLLLGGPGESRATIARAVEVMRRLDPDAVGVTLGLRLYRGTPLADALAPPGRPARAGVRAADGDLLGPSFFVEETLGGDVGAWLSGVVAGDRRFFFLAEGGADASYNYNDNRTLEDAIAAGARGAYWDILRGAGAR
ncbi:MAG TPA: radical SAM protein [Anaeromyxobacter sp.]|nr:radical SAM protein [Anaeromyxobacter sp.]